MTLKELQKIQETMYELCRFVEANSLRSDLVDLYKDSNKIIEDEKYRIHLRNAKTKASRKMKKVDPEIQSAMNEFSKTQGKKEPTKKRF